jgi:hypothetical protein
MLRILHLLDPHDGIETMLACRAAMGIADAAHTLWLVTNSAGERAAAAFGLECTDRIGTVLGRSESAARGLRTLLEHRTDDLGEPTPDIVQCWSARMLGAARSAFGKRIIPRCGFLARPPMPEVVQRSTAARLSKTAEERALDDTTLLTLDLTTRDSWAPIASSGRGALRMRDNIRVSLAPPLPAKQIASRAQIRQALGLEDRDVAAVLLADPPRAGDGMRFAFQIGLQHVGGVRITGISPRGTTNARRGARFVAGHGRRWGLIESAMPMDQLLAAADLAMWDIREDLTPSCGPTLIAAAINAAVPIAAAVHPVSVAALSAIPECLARDASTRAVAGKLFEFASDATARASVAARMSSYSESLRAAGGFRRTLLALWKERANIPIVRPGLPVPEVFTGAGA